MSRMTRGHFLDPENHALPTGDMPNKFPSGVTTAEVSGDQLGSLQEKEFLYPSTTKGPHSHRRHHDGLEPADSSEDWNQKFPGGHA